MSGMSIMLLFIYSGITINLLLHCGLGIKGTVESKNLHVLSLLAKSLIIFFSVILLWLLFAKVIYNLFPGILIYVLLFPLSYMFYDLIEYLVFRYLLKKESEGTCFIEFPGGITAAALFLCIIFANNFLEAAVLSFGFTFGIFFVNLFIREIRRRSTLEAVPVFLRGKPLILVSMGMLSLIFTTASFLLFRMIGIR